MSQTETPPLEGLGVTEIARLMGVTRQAAYELTAGPWNNGFPDPYMVVAERRRFWLREDVEAWIAARQSKSNNNGGDH